ncbi:arginine-tRNA-protein transferase [Natronospira proteinivora]|uniref:Aspartate/glutamate leucyltransferase n=1 Tax=Natronospira proteinivora TaxID=1807133 RepID=A0ABT1G8U5_9GAMM|nr:arginyltransferase [Natronospira proteinivora]MCP1726728.1 arginine-tRNA-protein transferase [Natronospira proteinivora]
MQRDTPAANAPRLLLTGEHPCPYREDQLSRNIVVEPGSVRGRSDHTAFSSIGFRRSGEYLYRPHCSACSACIPIRVPVAEFDWRRRYRRCWRQNKDLVVEERDTSFDPEAFQLYQRYQAHRHPGGPMAEGDEQDYLGFIQSQWADTRMICFYGDGELVAVAIVDWLEDGASAVYSFYEPSQSHRSLGQYTILWQIEAVRAQNRPYVYLGYWIQDSPKMAYKTEYKPAELMLGGRWKRLLAD